MGLGPGMLGALCQVGELGRGQGRDGPGPQGCAATSPWSTVHRSPPSTEEASEAQRGQPLVPGRKGQSHLPTQGCTLAAVCLLGSLLEGVMWERAPPAGFGHKGQGRGPGLSKCSVPGSQGLGVQASGGDMKHGPEPQPSSPRAVTLWGVSDQCLHLASLALPTTPALRRAPCQQEATGTQAS